MFGLRKVPTERPTKFEKLSYNIKLLCRAANIIQNNIKILNSRFVLITLYKTMKNMNKYKSMINVIEFFKRTWVLNIEIKLPNNIIAIGTNKGICNLCFAKMQVKKKKMKTMLIKSKNVAL